MQTSNIQPLSMSDNFQDSTLKIQQLSTFDNFQQLSAFNFDNLVSNMQF